MSLPAILDTDTRVHFAPDNLVIWVSVKIGHIITVIRIMPDNVSWYKIGDAFLTERESVYRDNTDLIFNPTAQGLAEICLAVLGLPK